MLGRLYYRCLAGSNVLQRLACSLEHLSIYKLCQSVPLRLKILSN